VGANSLVNFKERDVASKTGSTNNLRDAWLMGYSPNIAVGTWVGNNDNSPMGGGLSGLIVTPMWREFMDYALKKLPDEKFPQPQADLAGVKPIIRGDYIDSGMLASELAGSTTDSVNVSNILGGMHTILHFVDRANPRGPYPTNPAADQQYYNWEWGVQAWKNATYGSLVTSTTTLETDDEETPEEDTNPPRRRRN
jgi:membrane carboxypeptidase/penicillin-binding protein